MQTLVLGNGPMGLALADALRAAGEHVEVRGRPDAGGHPADVFAGIDVVFDFSNPDAVAPNITAGLAGGCRRFVIGTTGWDADRDAVERRLLAAEASAVAAANFSIGIGLFLRLVDGAVQLLGPLAEYDPYVLEWHRAGKVDRPSGTAKEIARRVLAAHPRKRRVRSQDRSGPMDPDELEVASVRAGASPGMHLVGFDAPGDSIELRVTARDRSAYAAGAIAAARWLLAAPRHPGLHDLDAILDDLSTTTDADGVTASPQGVMA
ncbi:MAG TPA: dihydrodipicolinate reductase C-terminal domain-containing protein [Candidatus Binatia bacterium]|nr:dihydrodipicolinate reductase C-terminal domain-containing protein [Candidatus Binatia bacterium]